MTATIRSILRGQHPMMSSSGSSRTKRLFCTGAKLAASWSRRGLPLRASSGGTSFPGMAKVSVSPFSFFRPAFAEESSRSSTCCRTSCAPPFPPTRPARLTFLQLPLSDKAPRNRCPRPLTRKLFPQHSPPPPLFSDPPLLLLRHLATRRPALQRWIRLSSCTTLALSKAVRSVSSLLQKAHSHKARRCLSFLCRYVVVPSPPARKLNSPAAAAHRHD